MTNSSIEELRDLTVILPTYNRHCFMFAAIRQWHPLVHQIIVVDGSEESRMVGPLDFPNVQYIHDTRSIEHRLARAAGLVRTQFSMVQSDDDIFVPEAVVECVLFLKANANYSASTPAAIRIARKGFQLAYPTSIGWDNSSELCSDRLQWLGSHYIPSSIYGVCRTDALRVSFESMAQDPLPVYAFAELHHEMVMNGLGRVRVQPIIGWIRRDVALSVDRNQNSLQSNWYTQEEHDLRRRYVEGVSRALSRSTGEDLAQKRREVTQGLEGYAEALLLWERRNYFKSLYKALVPKAVRRTLKSIKRSIYPGKDHFSDWTSLTRRLSQYGVAVSDETLELIAQREALERA